MNRYHQRMDYEWDAVVIGGGIIGLAVGRELARRGKRTAIIEERTIASGATQASAGVLAPYIEAPGEGALHDLTVRSLSLYDRFIADLQQDAGTAVEYRRQRNSRSRQLSCLRRTAQSRRIDACCRRRGGGMD